MKTNPRVLVPLVFLAPLGLVGGWPAERPTFQPKAGTRLAKHFTLQGDLDLEDSTMELDGIDQSELFGQVEIAMKVTQSIQVTDEFVSAEGSRVTQLKRTFDTLEGHTRVSGSHPMTGKIEQEVELASDLAGTTVLFTWDAEESAYQASFEEGKGDQELLVDLEADLDLAGFLPQAEVAEGDSWSIGADAVKSLLAPSGDLKLRAEESVDELGSSGQFTQSDLIGELEGEFKATFAGVRSEDGAQLAVIELDLEAHSARDMSDLLDGMREQMRSRLPAGVEADLTALDGEYAFDAEGELLWDLRAGLVHSLHLSGEVRQIIDTAMTMKMGSKSQSMESSQTFVGTQTLALTTSH